MTHEDLINKLIADNIREYKRREKEIDEIEQRFNRGAEVLYAALQVFDVYPQEVTTDVMYGGTVSDSISVVVTHLQYDSVFERLQKDFSYGFANYAQKRACAFYLPRYDKTVCVIDMDPGVKIGNGVKFTVNL